MSSKPKQAGRPRNKEADQAILDAALALMSERGYPGMSVDSVALAANVSKATIYRRWPSKAHLAVAAFDQLPQLTYVPSGRLKKDLEHITMMFCRFLTTTPLGKVYPSLISEAFQSPELLRLLQPIYSQRREPSRLAVQDAIERGELKADTDADAFAYAVSASVLMDYFLSGQAPDRQRVRHIIDMAVDGVSCATAGPPASGSQ